MLASIFSIGIYTFGHIVSKRTVAAFLFGRMLHMYIFSRFLVHLGNGGMGPQNQYPVKHQLHVTTLQNCAARLLARRAVRLPARQPPARPGAFIL